MRRLSVFALLALGCGPILEPPPEIRVAPFQSDATPPVGSPVFGKPIQSVQEPLLLKGIVLEDRGTRVVLAALDWCTTRAVAYHEFRRKIALAAGTEESHVALHCIHTHSAPYGPDISPEFLEQATDRAAAAVRSALPGLRTVTHVGIGQAKVEGFASNRRVMGEDGKIRVRYSATKDASLRAEPEGLIDPWIRTISLFDGGRPIVRLHYYASHPQSFYGDGHAHPDTPGWARSRLEMEEGIPEVYFTGCGGNVTAGKYNDGSPEARERLVERLVAGMRMAIASTQREPVAPLAWRTTTFPLEWRTDAKCPEPAELRPPIELTRLTLGPAEILGLPGEPFVEFQLYAQSLRPDRFVAVAGYGDGSPGYICTDRAYSEGGYEPTASRVGPPTEIRLRTALNTLLEDRKLRIIIFGAHPDDPESGAGGLAAMLTKAGHQVICAYGTCFRGDRKLGDEPEGAVRRREATAACKILGASAKFFDYAHEKLTADAETLQAVAGWLDEVKPDIVVTHWPLDTHENHHTVSSLVWRAYKHRGGWSLYYFEVMTGQQTLGFKPELYLDISAVRETKKAALGCHSSQKPLDIWRVHEAMHRLRGAECGVPFAEAYTLVEVKEGCALLPVAFLAGAKK